MSVPSSKTGSKSDPIVVGNKLRCPHCEELGDVLLAFKPLDRPEKYAGELNIVYNHSRVSGGCGHSFSPGNLDIIEAYLSGDLISKALLERAVERIRELEVELANIQIGIEV